MEDGAREPGAGIRQSGAVWPRAETGGSGSGNASPKARPRRLHQVANGYYTANRSGNALCPAFQEGICTAPFVAENRCANGVHQCARCLSREHGSGSCTKGAPPQVHPRRAGRGRGRGQGRGRGGRCAAGRGRGAAAASWLRHKARCRSAYHLPVCQILENQLITPKQSKVVCHTTYHTTSEL